MSSEKKNLQPGGSGVGEPPQKQPFSGSVRTGAEPFPGLSCSSCPGSLPMPAPPPSCMSDDMQGECFCTQTSSRRAPRCPLFPPIQHYFTAAGGDPSTLKAPVKAFTDFTNVEEWADNQARGIPRLEPPLAALLCPGAGWRPNEKPLPPDRLQRQIVGLTDKVFVCASQSAAVVNNIALLSSALVSLSVGREAYGPEEAARWLAVSNFSSAILQLL